MNKKIAKFTQKAAIAVATSCAIPSIALASDYSIKIGLIAPVGHPVEVATKSFAEQVKQRSDGKVTVKVFPSGQLGGEIELQDQVALGTIQAANIGTPVMSGKLKKLDILNMYYLWKDRDHMNKVLTGPVGQTLWDAYQNNTGVRVIASNWQQGTRHTLTKKSATTPQQMSGIKIRVPAGVPLYNDLWKSMGASPVPLAFPEANAAMKTGVVDAVELPFNWMTKGGFVELGSHVLLTQHYMYTNVVIINNRWLSRLPDDLQKIVVEAAQDAGKLNTQLILDGEKALRDEIQSKGIEFVDVDVAAFEESVQPVYKAKMGIWGQALFDQIQAAAN
ncbi:TRAP transporter substrate-binding protein [Marinomonas pollencensis]|uniref:Tripartite ATP-independent transporter DctP family solute receptor n=1 Tax=Marinomonas pollencensis TaxID=491954 RepID=A0A3E0DR99_9GAMM|nr:TRAP transporter substrate-binding protein [Marinomonas pollencensis]REG85638.1 tripartite ATP-independent transporter DctP family solute receptor [Marinomonas pollencensis]